MACPHEQTEPIIVAVSFMEIGKMCADCFEVLPSWWNCTDCERGVSMTLAGERWSFLIEPCHAHYNSHL